MSMRALIEKPCGQAGEFAPSAPSVGRSGHRPDASSDPVLRLNPKGTLR